MSETAIKIEHVSKVYRLYHKPLDRVKESMSFFSKKEFHHKFYALNDISLEIKKGESIGIIGKNGSGKSTLLKIISSVLTQTEGQVFVDGRVSALLELGTGFNPEYTGIENIYANGLIMGYSKAEMDDRLDNIVKFADIGEYINQPVKTYSSGMFARLAFATAINVDPEILIVDEVLAVGDAKFQIKCINKMEEFKAAGKTVLFV
ncbi:MAG: teichoic acid transport system ATP-binding protein, partial [Eubacteriaceae bacterium]|nr:teichoic acid transport system ATP-binding protein [Eubacteriaceae bacterium]